MKGIPQFWGELVSLTTRWGLSNVQQREIQSLVLDGIEPLPELVMATDGAAEKSVNSKPATPFKSRFKFGKASLKELEGVNVDLVRVTRRALELTSQDFCVFDGIRTYKEQQLHVANGTSKTMQSKHLQGLAVDLVPWIGGKPVWDWGGCYKIAVAMDQAATELGVADRITWGGAWDRKLSDFGGDTNEYSLVVAEYQNRHPGPDFLDGPHYEITSR